MKRLPAPTGRSAALVALRIRDDRPLRNLGELSIFNRQCLEFRNLTLHWSQNGWMIDADNGCKDAVLAVEGHLINETLAPMAEKHEYATKT